MPAKQTTRKKKTSRRNLKSRDPLQKQAEERKFLRFWNTLVKLTAESTASEKNLSKRIIVSSNRRNCLFLGGIIWSQIWIQ